jgi:hypothetical protein
MGTRIKDGSANMPKIQRMQNTQIQNVYKRTDSILNAHTNRQTEDLKVACSIYAHRNINETSTLFMLVQGAI